MPADLRQRRLRLPVDLLGAGVSDTNFTDEQQYAIATRSGSLLLAAGAGSGKTSVVVERFVRLLLDDGLAVPEILAITFTEKAAGELGERIRTALRTAARTDLAHAAESAWISTIHGFCARILREHALAAGLDPQFAVLEPDAALQLRHDAFAAALRETARTGAGRELIAAYGPVRLRRAIIGAFLTLRSQGQEEPRLPVVPAAPDDEPGTAQELAVAAAAQDLVTAAGAALRELAAAADAAKAGKVPKRVIAAMTMLETVPERLAGGLDWPGELDAIKLGTGAGALKIDVCDRYRAALASLRDAVLARLAGGVRDGLNALLHEFAERYAEAKRTRSAVDFEDLELRALALLRQPAIAEHYQQRFRAVMVDEMQDTNAVQLELIELVARDHLFMVGDAQQSIYGFRHADVELFLSRRRQLARNGAAASLRTNFRSAPELLEVVNRCFEDELGDEFMALKAGRVGSEASPRTPPGPPVELILAERLDLAARRSAAAAELQDETAATAAVTAAATSTDADAQLDVPVWRLAEARALAARIAELVASGAVAPQDVVLLARASTDLGAYERALAEQGLPTQLLAGRGFWQHPQVAALVAYLRALANPLDEPAYGATLLSPLCGLSLDGVLLLRVGARKELSETDAARLDDFERWFAGERRLAVRSGAELLLDRALARNGYLQQIATAADGARRLANVRKLQRIARDWELGQSGDLRALLTALALRASADDGIREAEASVAAAASDAVRLMTIHAAKGLEFPVVCVVDLGRGTPGGAGPLIRVGRDGRLGLKLGRPGSGELLDALDYEALGAEQREREAAEERRLFYVAMTRAREHLILSGAALLGDDFAQRNRLAPIGWLAPALVPGIAELGPDSPEPALRSGGVRVSFVPAAPTESPAPAIPAPVPTPIATPGPALAATPIQSPAGTPAQSPAADAAPTETLAVAETAGSAPIAVATTPDTLSPVPASGPAPERLSYSALAAYERCGYRFYLERMLGLGYRDASPAADTGIAVHDLLRKLDLADPERGLADVGLPEEALTLTRAFVTTELADRLATAPELRREQPFTFLVSGILISGVFDAVAVEEGGNWLIADYKTDRLDAGDDPEALVADRYSGQQLIYALAALMSGAPAVEVEHLFLRAPDRPVTARYEATQVEQLRTALERRLAPLEAGRYPVTDTPGYRRCDGCPAAGGLCPYPRELTRR